MKTQELFYRISRAVLVLVAGLLLPVLAVAAGIPDQLLTVEHPNVRAVIAVQEKVTKDLMALQDILGTAVGLDAQGQAALVIYVNAQGKDVAAVAQAIPGKIGGVNVSVEMTDPIHAFGGKPGGGGTTTTVSHTAIQTPPIKLGTSGGWRNDLANGYCCSGTLGSLISVNGAQYILSNYHVFESDTVPGGNGIVATTGDYIIQPGLVDVNCTAGNAQNVATLVTLSSLPGSNVDASIAQVIPGMVDSGGAILEIGTISSQTIGASLNQAVKKSGRTTRLTKSTVTGLNATVSVTYDNECAGGVAFTNTFTGQILIANRGSRFLNSGDSGSLMVENVTANPKAVGLLYAGSSSIAVANPIDEVLSFIGGKLGGTATMVGN